MKKAGPKSAERKAARPAERGGPEEKAGTPKAKGPGGFRLFSMDRLLPEEAQQLLDILLAEAGLIVIDDQARHAHDFIALPQIGEMAEVIDLGAD